MSFGEYRYPPDNDGTQAEMLKDTERWQGVPPVGDRPISKMRLPYLWRMDFLPKWLTTGKWAFLILVLFVFCVKILIWGTYRYFTGSPDLIPFFASKANVYWAGMVAKPILQLGPVFFLWYFIFKEKGIPFRFTKKNLFSSVAWGCIGGLIFFIVASFVYVAHMYIRGLGSEFSLVVGWDTVGWGLVIATMFSYMIGTGPAEEIFSRGFLQDQSARVLPVGRAIVFSAVLFAIGHIPVSIFLYHLHETREGMITLCWYMVVLFIMGCFFSIIYHWSRNIVLGIVIHGLWDWYLTLYQIKGAYTTSMIEASMSTFGFLDTVNTLITLAIMLPIFYLLYRKFWRKDARESDDAIGPVKAIRRLDRGHIFKRSWQPWVFTIAVCFVFCILMIPAGALLATDDPGKMKDRREEPIILTNVYNLTFEQTDVAQEGQPITYPLEAEQGNIFQVTVHFTWEDEPDESQGFFRQYDNQPDMFRIVLRSASGEDLQSGENDQGTITLNWRTTEETALNGTFTLDVDLVNAGDQESTLPFVGDIPDDSNAFTVSVDYKSVEFVEKDEDDYHIRW